MNPDLEPGIYCGSDAGIFPVNYTDVPDVPIHTARKFRKKLAAIRPGHRIYGSFNRHDLAILEQLKGGG